MSDPAPCPSLPLGKTTLSWDWAGQFGRALKLNYRLIRGAAPSFRDGSALVGWHKESLVVLATFTDDFITSKATDDFQRMWVLGDVFEAFVRDLAGEEYWEYHVSSNGHVLQLKFPYGADDGEPRRGPEPVEHYYVPANPFRALTRTTSHGWQILAEIPWPYPAALKGREALVSFSRYDYGPEGTQPILSSTSPHPRANFHRQAEWTKIVFVD